MSEISVKTKVLNIFRRVFMIPFAERTLANLTRGKSPEALISRLPALHFLYPENSIRTVTRDGIRYRLDLSDSVDWYIYFGFSESSRMKLYALIRPGDVVMDIGANVGDVTLHCSKLVGREGRVLAFEPDPVNFQRLTTNLTLNNFENIKVHNIGFGDVPGTFRMALDHKDNKGMTRIAGDDYQGSHAEVAITTLDEFCSGKEFPGKVNVVKIDVEGFETRILRGANTFIKKYRPKLFVELSDNLLKLQQSSARELVSLLESYGYRLQHSETGTSVTRETDLTGCHFDVICEMK